MGACWAICKRELRAYFTTPLAYVFIVIFVALNGATTFYFGGLFDRGQADLQPLFSFLPWLYLFLIPAVAMRLWAEERKSGTLELLMTLPVSTTKAVFGKFLAAWIFTGIALGLNKHSARREQERNRRCRALLHRFTLWRLRCMGQWS